MSYPDMDDLDIAYCEYIRVPSPATRFKAGLPPSGTSLGVNKLDRPTAVPLGSSLGTLLICWCVTFVHSRSHTVGVRAYRTTHIQHTHTTPTSRYSHCAPFQPAPASEGRPLQLELLAHRSHHKEATNVILTCSGLCLIPSWYPTGLGLQRFSTTKPLLAIPIVSPPPQTRPSR